MLADWMTQDELLREYPELTEDEVRVCLGVRVQNFLRSFRRRGVSFKAAENLGRSALDRFLDSKCDRQRRKIGYRYFLVIPFEHRWDCRFKDY